MRALFAITMLLAFAAPGPAAELPSRKASEPPHDAKRCEVGGRPGFLSPDGQTCLAISGYVSGQIAGGSLK